LESELVLFDFIFSAASVLSAVRDLLRSISVARSPSVVYKNYNPVD